MLFLRNRKKLDAGILNLNFTEKGALTRVWSFRPWEFWQELGEIFQTKYPSW